MRTPEKKKEKRERQREKERRKNFRIQTRLSFEVKKITLSNGKKKIEVVTGQSFL